MCSIRFLFTIYLGVGWGHLLHTLALRVRYSYIKPRKTQKHVWTRKGLIEVKHIIHPQSNLFRQALFRQALFRQALFRRALFRHFKVYWCRSSSPSPVCFNIDADRAVNSLLNPRWVRLPSGGCTCLERSAFVSQSKDFTAIVSPGC